MEKLICTFEKLLETNPQKIEKRKTKEATPFETTRDEGLIRGLSFGLPVDHTDRLVTLFSKLTLFFDAGVFLENSDGQWQSTAYFSEGELHVFHFEQARSINIPDCPLFTVMACPADVILKKLDLSHLDKAKNLQCLLIKPSNDCGYLLFSKLPDLWLKPHVENIKRAIQNSFA